MPVAPSYQSMVIMGEPYISNKKMYIQIKNPKTGTIRTARWYTEEEYAKIYKPKEVAESAQDWLKYQHDALGFQKGYITIFKGVTETHQEWFQTSSARYCRWWGWYIVSTEEVPADLPADVQPIRLEWSGVGMETGQLKPEEQVVAHINSLLFPSDGSEWQGAVNDRLDLTLRVTEISDRTTQYGLSRTHYFIDNDNNKYSWTTSAQNWSVDDIKHIKGTVKAHLLVKNSKITQLTRCQEVK